MREWNRKNLEEGQMGKRVCASFAEVFFCFWFMLAEPGVVLLAWGGYVFPGGLLCFELGEDVVGGVYEVGFCGFGSRGAERGGLEDEVASSHEGVAGGYFLHVVSGSYAAVPGFEGDSLREAELGGLGDCFDAALFQVEVVNQEFFCFCGLVGVVHVALASDVLFRHVDACGQEG